MSNTKSLFMSYYIHKNINNRQLHRTNYGRYHDKKSVPSWRLNTIQALPVCQFTRRKLKTTELKKLNLLVL